MEVAARIAATPGAAYCGDGVYVYDRPPLTTLAVIDGLGHGVRAQEAMRAAVGALEKAPCLSPGQLLLLIDGALVGTVGVACSIAQVHAARSLVLFAGVGNVRGRLLGPNKQQWIGEPGILGENRVRAQESRAAYCLGDTIVLFSDGIERRFWTSPVDRAAMTTAQQLADYVFTHFRTRRDDAAVLVGR